MQEPHTVERHTRSFHQQQTITEVHLAAGAHTPLTATMVKVEIFTAGDGINYPQRGKHVVIIHYTGYVRALPLATLPLL